MGAKGIAFQGQVMTEPARARLRPSIPWGLIGMLVLVAVVEHFIAANRLRFANHTAFTWRYVSEAARGPEGKADLLCLGDSLVKVGVLPRVLEQRMGGSAYNLATFGGQAPSSYFLLRAALKSGAKPRAVIVDFHANLLAITPKTNSPYWSDLVDARDAVDLAASTLNFSLIGSEIGGWLLPSYKGRDEIRGCIRNALLNDNRSGEMDRLSMRHNWEIHAGAHIVAATHKPFAQIETNPTSRGRWVPHPVNATYLRRLLQLAKTHNIEVFWLIPPTHPDFQLRRERLGLDAPFTEFVQSVQQQYANVVVVDGRHSAYDRSLFLDATHLNLAGAQKLSTTLAEVVKARMEGSKALARWVEIPPAGDSLAESRKTVRQ